MLPVSFRRVSAHGRRRGHKSTISLTDAAEETGYPTGTPLDTPAPESSTAPVMPTIIPTTISGGLSIKNTSGYDIDIDSVLSAGCPIRLEAGKPQILIIHTHSSEAYSPAGLDKYDDLGTNRTLDQNLNVIRIGKELAKIFEDCGLNVIHDTQVFDYPSYTGSYNRSCEAVENIWQTTRASRSSLICTGTRCARIR